MGFVLWPGVQAYVNETLYPASVNVVDIRCTPYNNPMLPIPFSETVHASKISVTAIDIWK